MKTIRTACNFCSIGCNLDVTVQDDGSLKVRPAEHVVNQKKVCPKGFNLLNVLDSPSRGTKPLLRNESGEKEEVSWDKALGTFADKIKEINNKHGDGSTAYISTGQIPFEEMALLGVVGRMGMKMHGDGNTRQCMASAAVAYKQAFGFDAPSLSYQDIEESDCLFFWGANPVVAHVILLERYKLNKTDRDLFVIDPRKTETAELNGAVHIPVAPKGDLALLYTMANVLIQKDWVNKEYIAAHVEGFEDFKEHVRSFTLETVQERSGVEAASVEKMVDAIHRRKNVSIWWTMGVNQSHQGTRTAQAIINLCLMTGNIGRAGAGPFSITGQSNAMGSRLFSYTTAAFAGRDFAKPEDRKVIADIMDIDEKHLVSKPSLPYDKIIEGIQEGKIKALWLIATNPLHSWIDTNGLREALSKLDFLVIQDIYKDIETMEYAHLYLPAAGVPEKEGTIINSERRLGVVQKIRNAPGESLSDFDIFKKLASHYGCDHLIKGWDSPAQAFQLLKRMSKGMPCDITGVRDYQMILDNQGIQWPYPQDNPDTALERRLFEDGKFYTPSGKAKMLFEDVRPSGELADEEYPLTLLSGRGSVVQFQTQTRTSKSKILAKMVDPNDIYVELNQSDAVPLGIHDGDMVEIQSRRGSVQAKARIEKGRVGKGCIYIPFHYWGMNNLTFPEFDTYSREPSYKCGAVRAAKVQA